MRTLRLMLPVLSAMALTAWAAFAGGPVHGASYTVNVAAATVEGKSAQILTDADGLALYYLTSDSLASPACTGGCVKAWPPLLSSTTPTGPSSLPGKLTVVQAANGSQVSYNGHLLYRYGADTKSGQVNGNRVAGPKGGEWYVATSSMAVVRGGGTDNNDRGDGGMGNY